MSTQTTEETSTIEGLDFAPVCGTTIVTYNPHTGDLSNPSDPCQRPAKWIVTKHRPARGCINVDDFACDYHHQLMKNTNCPHCGKQLHSNPRPL